MNIFNLPGLGRLMLIALDDRDYPVVYSSIRPMRVNSLVDTGALQLGLDELYQREVTTADGRKQPDKRHFGACCCDGRNSRQPRRAALYALPLANALSASYPQDRNQNGVRTWRLIPTTRTYHRARRRIWRQAHHSRYADRRGAHPRDACGRRHRRDDSRGVFNSGSRRHPGVPALCSPLTGR